jgi:hypothetical protein
MLDVPSASHTSNPNSAPISSRLCPKPVKGARHRRAIDRLTLELRAREGLRCLLHSGASETSLVVLAPDRHVLVLREKQVQVGGRRLCPDLTVRCARTYSIIALIEVWHTHAVGSRKRELLSQTQAPWIEVRAHHVLGRHRSRPLAVVDWGGLAKPSPHQFRL